MQGKKKTKTKNNKNKIRGKILILVIREVELIQEYQIII